MESVVHIYNWSTLVQHCGRHYEYNADLRLFKIYQLYFKISTISDIFKTAWVKFHFRVPLKRIRNIGEMSIFFIKFQVFQVILHEHFNYKLGLDNDIALLKLKTEATFTDYVQPSCLWTEKVHERSPTKEIYGTVSNNIQYYLTFTSLLY